MIVDPQVDVAVVEAGVTAARFCDIQCGALLPASVAAGGLSGTQRRDESIGEVPLRLLERARKAIHDAFACENVPLRGVVRARDAARPIHASRAGERRRTSGRVDDAELSLVSMVVGVGEPTDDFFGRFSLLQQREPTWAVRRVRPRLRRDRADAADSPWHG